MTRNTLGSLNDYLFEELERLNEADVADAEACEAEIRRAKAMEGMARSIVDNARTILESVEARARLTSEARVPAMLTGGE